MKINLKRYLDRYSNEYSTESKHLHDTFYGITDLLTKFAATMMIVSIFLLALICFLSFHGCKSVKLAQEDYYRISQRFVEDSIDQSSLTQMQFYASDSFSLIRTGFTANYRPQIINGEIFDGKYPKVLTFEKYEKGTLFEEGSNSSLLFIFDKMDTLPLSFFPKGNEFVLGNNDLLQIGEAFYKTSNKNVILLAKRHDMGEIRPATGSYYEDKNPQQQTQQRQNQSQPSPPYSSAPQKSGSNEGVRPEGIAPPR